MDALFIIIALALIWRGPELAKLMDALWEEWTRPSADVPDVQVSVVPCDIHSPAECRGVQVRPNVMGLWTELHLIGTYELNKSERRARVRAYRAGRGFRVKK